MVMQNKNETQRMNPKPPGVLAWLSKMPEWLKYDADDPEQRRDARISIAILAIGGVIAIIRQFGFF